MDLFSARSLVSTSSTPILPFPDLAKFIAECEPSSVNYALSSQSSTSPSTIPSSTEIWYVQVPTSVHSNGRRIQKHSDSSKTPMNHNTDQPHSDGPPKNAVLLQQIESFVQYTQRNIVPSLKKLFYNAHSMAYYITQTGFNAAKFIVFSAGRVAKLLSSIISGLLYGIWHSIYLVASYAAMFVSFPLTYSTRIFYSVFHFFYSLAIVQLYIIPMSCIAALATVVGGLAGAITGLTIVIIQYIFPSAVSSHDPSSTLAQSMVKEFTAKHPLHHSSDQTLTKNDKILLPTATFKPLKEPSPPTVSSPSFTLPDAPPNDTDPLSNSELIKSEASLSSIESLGSSGKHEAYTSDYEDDPEHHVQEKSSATNTGRYTSKLSPEPLPHPHSPLYEDEDGYFNYLQSSYSSDMDYSSSATTSTAITSPISIPILSSPAERRFKLTRHRRGSLSPPLDTSAAGPLDSVKSVDFDTESVTTEEVIDDQDSNEIQGKCIAETAPIGAEPQLPYPKNFLNSFEPITEESD